MADPAGYYRHPTIHGDAVVFVCEDDLWTVPTGGGLARRLTANPGRMSFPQFSPDGTWVAFTGQEEGPNEVYVVAARGGPPRRLTWLGAMTQVAGWTPDGKRVVFATDWRQFQPGLVQLWSLGLDEKDPRPLGHGPARTIAFEPGGKGVVIGRNSGDPARWKRYRGGTAGTIWIDREGKGDFEELVPLAGNLASPLWIGSRIWFLSDHEGHANLYSCTPRGRGLERHTDHEDFFVRFPSTDGRRIVYHAGADLYVYDTKTRAERVVPVTLASPRVDRRRRFVSATRHLESADLHPSGLALGVVTRGGSFSLPLWAGAPARHGRPSAERHRLATWLPDGNHLVTVADLGDEECLVVHDTVGTARPRVVKGDIGRPIELVAAPAGGRRVALTNHRQEVVLVDLQGGKVRRLDRSPYDRIDGIAWSPDGRYLAYGLPVSTTTSLIKVWDATTDRTHEVTRPDFRDVRPAFDPAGRYLYFLSWRVFDPVYDAQYFDLGFPRGARPHLVILQKGVPSPFDAAQRPPRAPEGGPPGAAEAAAQAAKAKKGKTPRVRIDFPGIQERVAAFPVPEARYERVLGAEGRALFSSSPIEGSLDAPWPDTGAPPAHARLEAWDYEKDRVDAVANGITDFRVTPDGRYLALRVGNRIRVLPAGVKADALSKEERPGRDTGWVDLDRLRVEVRPYEEWAQMFREAWRLQRDQFWTPDMSGIDWRAVYDRYLPLVERVSTRSEFSDLLWEMQGELGTSHCYEMGGDYRPVPGWHQGHLGVDLAFEKRTQAWVVSRVPRGDAWDPARSSPLAAPGVDVGEGDRIVAIDGEVLGRDRSPYEALVHRADQAIRLTVRSPNAKKDRQITLRALRGEYGLRYRAWVEGNREVVHAKTRGKVGYVHVPDMGPRGFAEFHRYYRSEVEHDGLVVDVRFNGGGHVSQLLLQKLLRKRIGYDRSRWQAPIPYPMHAPMGPMVALTNEYAGSDGDMFSHAFKLYGLGPLIGRRTWGGVVGIWPRHMLVDGTVTTQPEFSHWFVDVGWGVENYGTEPDIEVDIRPQDHAAGKDPQLDRAIREILAALKREKPALPDFRDRPNLNPPKLPRS